MKEITEHYIKILIPNPAYNNPKPTKDRSLLVKTFNEALERSISKFNLKYPDIEVVFVETYRSNALQKIHYDNGASKIKKDGMHHYGIAADLAFKINGKFSYNGDYKHLRQCHEAEGLYLLGLWDIGHVQMIPVSEQQTLRNEVLKAVKKLQKENGLVVDGVVGPKTIGKAKEKTV